MVKLTPGMQQYMDIKNAHEDCIILFRMGDFYETFFEDAKTIARELEITLTSRGKGESEAPLAGIPYHAIEPYIAKLVKKGYKVGIVEQIEDPKKAKGLVKRALIRIITPGTVIDSGVLEKNKNNYILCLYPFDRTIGFSFSDVSTGEFFCAEIKKEKLISEFERINPSEIIYPESQKESQLIKSIQEQNIPMNALPDRFFQREKATDTLTSHFNVINLEGYGIKNERALQAAGGLLSYIKETQMNNVSHITKIQPYNTDSYMFLDKATIRNLELIHNIIHKNEEATLLSVIDNTTTPMGKRLIKKWIVNPLISKEKINERLDAVDELKEHIITRQEIYEAIKKVYDIERLVGRVAYGNANPKDIVALGISLKHVPKIKEELAKCKSNLLKDIAEIPDTSKAQTLIQKAIKEDPAIITREGNIIRRGYNEELDKLKDISLDAKSYIAEIEEKEKERTGIKSLKIKYNKVVGYYIDITKPNVHLVPEDYIRKQSQVNSERFFTEELKDLEEKILGAQERIYELEYELFSNVLEELQSDIVKMQQAAEKIAHIDCLISFAIGAQERGYCKPQFNNEGIIEMKGAKHPVIERLPKVDFITNDCIITNEKRTMIITGPNMAGKSTYLRQVALIVLMAQIGCFVPAKEANLQITDRVFSRIGAYDDLVNKQSTFMVEMNETANILNNATEKSLVILDEIGRGTSTFDGVSLAWAITEHLHTVIACKTLFATHYHHLNSMNKKYEGIQNFNVAVDESNERILFLHKIIPGGTDKSYGIQVAKLAGIPNQVISAAKEIMQNIEQNDTTKEIIHQDKNNQEEKKNKEQLQVLTHTNEIQDTIKNKEEETNESEKSKIEKLEDEIAQIKKLLQGKYL